MCVCVCVCVSVGGGTVPVESDGRPRGSFNRWNYNEVYRPATPLPGTVVRQLSGPRVTNNESHYHRWRQTHRYTTTPAPTPGHRVEQDAKSDVDWAYDSLTFYLRVSVT